MVSLLSLSKRLAKLHCLSESPSLPGLNEKVQALRRQPWPSLPLNSKFVVFDTETTGLSCKKGDEIISLGAVKLEDGEITEHFHHMVDPKRNIPAKISQITGITNEMAADCPDILEVLDRFLEFQGCFPLIAHNASFDLGFINLKLRQYCGIRLSIPVMDTFLLSQLLFPSAECHSLDCLAGSYDVPITDRHTALGDAIITARIFAKMVQDLKARGVTTTLELQRLLHHRRLVPSL